MRKLLPLIAILLCTFGVYAQSFVMLNTENQQETEGLFDNSNLKIHYYNDNFVLATAKVVDDNMTVLDNQSFANNNVYYIVYCGKENQENYISEIKAENVLFRNDNILIVNNFVKPFKNDGMIAVFNREAKMALAHRDFPVVTEENTTIREMMNQVDMDSLEATVQYLQDYQSRMWNSDNAFAASDWIAGRMEALGLEVEQQPFYASTWYGSGQAAPNVIGIQRGTLYPDVYVVCGSHFDSFAYSGNCPGADDNATGVASVLESARIMTQYDFEYSIIYCAYGCEEMGLYGSEAYASRCQQEGMEIIGYFNNDMNAYLNPGDQIHIDLIYPNSVAPIGNYYMNVAGVYFPELPVRHVNFNEGDSDHTSFNNHGYMGIYPFEDYQNYSPYIHTSNDLIGNSANSFEMSQQYCRMNIGCLAEIANPVGEPQIYCNAVENFAIDDHSKEMSTVILTWEEPLPGSTGACVSYQIYRDENLIAILENTEYEYTDTITVGVSASYYVTSVYDDECEASSEIIEVIGQHDGLNDVSLDNVSFYPNPVNDVVYIKGDVIACEVYDLVGKLLLSEESTSNIAALRVNDLTTGIYMIKFTSANGNVITKKLIKK